ncbi:hypothetical protein ACFSDB_12175 [Planococcus chinensis]|uniref:Uncharacterized protein n=1 Tax=Planococcus chinensis TaxID=272917 RepID=A0ABW4QJ65_9BACL
MNGAFCHSAPDRSDLEGLGIGTGQEKCGSGRLDSTGVRRFGEAACFQPHSHEKRKCPVSSVRHKVNQRRGALCHIAGLTYVQKSWALETRHEVAYDPRIWPL